MNLMNLVRWAIFVGGLGLTSLFLWSHERWLDWTWLNTHKNKTLIEFAAQLLLVFVFINIPLRRHWKIWLPLVIAITVAILQLARI
jgi:hypothetical protein